MSQKRGLSDSTSYITTAENNIYQTYLEIGLYFIKTNLPGNFRLVCKVTVKLSRMMECLISVSWRFSPLNLDFITVKYQSKV